MKYLLSCTKIRVNHKIKWKTLYVGLIEIPKSITFNFERRFIIAIFVFLWEASVLFLSFFFPIPTFFFFSTLDFFCLSVSQLLHWSHPSKWRNLFSCHLLILLVLSLNCSNFSSEILEVGALTLIIFREYLLHIIWLLSNHFWLIDYENCLSCLQCHNWLEILHNFLAFSW